MTRTACRRRFWGAGLSAALLACACAHPERKTIAAAPPPAPPAVPVVETQVVSSTASVSDLLHEVESAYRGGRYDEGLALVKRTLELGRSDLSVVDRVGSIYYLLGRYGEAISVWEQGLRLEKNPRRQAVLSRSIGLARRSLGLPEPTASAEKLPLVRRHARGKPSGRLVARIYDRGVAHYARGEYLEATADFMRVLELNPQHALAKRALARLRLDASDQDGNQD